MSRLGVYQAPENFLLRIFGQPIQSVSQLLIGQAAGGFAEVSSSGWR
jgi:hypothetical protein